MSMRAINNTLVGCELFNVGIRMRTYGYGLDAVQSYDLTVRDCYFHGTRWWWKLRRVAVAVARRV